jgi:hypothetical protein
MDLVLSSILKSDNKAIPQLHEVLKIESHLRTEVLGRGNPGDLYFLFVIVLSHHLVQPLFGGLEVTRCLKRIL